jgi:hypothetical protein
VARIGDIPPETGDGQKHLLRVLGDFERNTMVRTRSTKSKDDVPQLVSHQ